MGEGHPVQPMVRDKHGVERFKPNAIVRFLLDAYPDGLNGIAARGLDFTDEDRCQFAQLIGYSLSGYSELSYVSDEEWSRVEQRATPEGGER